MADISKIKLPDGSEFNIKDSTARTSYAALSSAIPSAYTSNPAALGSASPGSSSLWARGDHVHVLPTASQVGAVAVA